MHNYYRKIKDKFIETVITGHKRREYRLASPENKQIKVGDTLVLISNTNTRKYIKVTVVGIEYFDNWLGALSKYWQEDFYDLYSTIDEAQKECYKFYRKEKVDMYGILVFHIKPIEVNYTETDVLLDTNIVIRRESANNVSFEISNLYKWFDKKHIHKVIHQITIDEINGYGKETDKEAILTKLASYNLLPNIKYEQDQYFDNVISKYSQDKNSLNDNELLRQIYYDIVGILVTSDNLMLRKAQELFIRDRVLTPNELLQKYENEYPSLVEYKMLAVKYMNFSDVNLNDHFFDALREDYEGRKFDDWFKRKAIANEKAYVFQSANDIQGFLYLKIEDSEENYSDIKPLMTKKKRLKVGTFKINSSGFRLGERFIKIIVDNAIKLNVDEVYVTLYENKRQEVNQLKLLMEEWGFHKHGYKDNGEVVLIKSMRDYDANKSPKYNFPLLKKKYNTYYLPIEARYHTDLFPDNILNDEDMRLYEENKAHRYAIEKIYLTGSYNIKANPGDLLVIYRKGERYPKKYTSVITGISIVEEILQTKDVEECIKECKNRSIFDEQEIRNVYSKYPTIIKLLDYMPFDRKIYRYELQEKNLLEQDGPRPFTYINNEQLNIIYQLSKEEK